MNNNTNCLSCPLYAFCDACGEGYVKDADKIRAKDPHHTIRSHCIEEHWSPCDVLFVGEAPGREEDAEGKVFIGESGQLLRMTIREVIAELRIKRSYGMTNIVRCRPPMNRKPSATITKCCSGRLFEEIRVRKPKVIVALGNTPLTLLTGESGITALNGKWVRILPELGIPARVLGCFHPAYISRADYLLPEFCKAIEIALSSCNLQVDSAPEVLQMDVRRLLRSPKRALQGLQRIAESGEPFSFDFETGVLHPHDDRYPQLLCISLSQGPGERVVVPLDHPEVDASKNWSPVREAVKNLLASPVRKYAHNSKFDCKHAFHAFGVWPPNTVCTMMMAYTLDERRGSHGLKVLAYKHTSYGGYDRPLDEYKKAHAEADPEKGGSYANIPAEVLFPYAGIDAEVTYLIRAAMEQNPEWPVQQPRCDQFYPELLRTLGMMEYRGAQIDRGYLQWLRGKYSRKMEVSLSAIREDPLVQELEGIQGKPFNPRSPKQLQEVLYRLGTITPDKLTDSGRERVKDLAEQSDMGFRDALRMLTDEGAFSIFTTDAEVMEQYAREGHPLAKLVLDYRCDGVVLSTFINGLETLLDRDGLLHGNYLPAGTVTARLASNSPNLQNQPGGDIRRMYVSRYGDEGVVIALDYSQIELRVAACYFNVPEMIEVYRVGGDLHRLTAIKISGLSPAAYDGLESTLKTSWRMRAKRVNFGIIYCATANTIQASLQGDGVFLSIDECQDMLDQFFASMPALREGIEDLKRSVLSYRYLQAFTGQRRRLPEAASDDVQIVERALRQSVNFPIQHIAGLLTLLALILIDRAFERRRLRAHLILTVHDSIEIDAHMDDAIEAAALAKGIMENVIKKSQRILPLDWSWFKVPLVADCEIGLNWADQVKFDPSVVRRGEIGEGPLVSPDGKMRNPVNAEELCDAMLIKAEKGYEGYAV